MHPRDIINRNTAHLRKDMNGMIMLNQNPNNVIVDEHYSEHFTTYNPNNYTQNKCTDCTDCTDCDSGCEDCGDCGCGDNSSGCGGGITIGGNGETCHHNKCSTTCESMRIYKQANEITTEGDLLTKGLGYHIVDFKPEVNNQAGINFSNTTCGEHEMVFDCTMEPIHENAMKVCTINETYFDAENCRWVYMYRFLGLPDINQPDGGGGDDITPDKPGSSDVYMHFIHPSYDLRVKIGFFQTDINFEDVKRDAGRVIHSCLSGLITNKTDDKISFSPTGSGGKMTDVDWFTLAQYLSYKDYDYTKYGYGEGNDLSYQNRSKNPPLTKYKLRLCPGDAQYICTSEGFDNTLLDGYIIYESEPFNDSSDYFYKLTFVLRNGDEYEYYSGNDGVTGGSCGGDNICIPNNMTRKTNRCLKSISGGDVQTSSAITDTITIGKVCASIGGYNSSFDARTFDVGTFAGKCLFVWIEKKDNGCGTNVLTYNSEIIDIDDYTAMSDFGSRIISNISNIIMLHGTFAGVPYTNGKSLIAINDYRPQASLDTVAYWQQEVGQGTLTDNAKIRFFGPAQGTSFKLVYRTSEDTSISNFTKGDTVTLHLLDTVDFSNRITNYIISNDPSMADVKDSYMQTGLGSEISVPMAMTSPGRDYVTGDFQLDGSRIYVNQSSSTEYSFINQHEVNTVLDGGFPTNRGFTFKPSNDHLFDEFYFMPFGNASAPLSLFVYGFENSDLLRYINAIKHNLEDNILEELENILLESGYTQERIDDFKVKYSK